jgi:hypothetical protein
MHIRHRPRALRSAGALSVRLLLTMAMIAGALALNFAGAEPAGATVHASQPTIVRSPDGLFITATSERMHELQVHVTVVMSISRLGHWNMEVYAHNTARTRKKVTAGAVVRSPATGVTLDVEISNARIGADVYDVFVDRDLRYDDMFVHGDDGDEVFADPNLFFDLWIDVDRL